MSARFALTSSVAVLAALSVLLTAYLLPVPIWVVFIAWASFFASGGGKGGFVRSLVMNLVGVAAATLALIAASLLGGSPVAVALCVAVSAGALVVIGGTQLLSFTPAGFFGYASAVGTSAATVTSFTDPVGLSHPALVAAVALVVGAVFGIVSELVSTALTRKTPLIAATETRTVTPSP